MATIDRTDIIRGPAAIGFGGETFYSKGDITVTVEQASFDKVSDVFGIVGRAITDRQVKVRFTPIGEIQALAVLFPYGTAATYPIGTSIYGAADTALTVNSIAKKLIVHNCAVTQMPSLTLGAGTTAFGECEITGLVKNDASAAVAASYWTWSTGSYTIPTTMEVAKLIAAQYQATWAGVTVSATDAFTVDFDLTLAPVISDGIGTVDMRIQDLQFTSTFEPVGYASWPGDILAYMATRPGSELYTSALTIATAISGGLSFAADKTTLANLDIMWGAAANLVGPVTVTSHRDIDGGGLDNLFTVSVV